MLPSVLMLRLHVLERIVRFGNRLCQTLEWNVLHLLELAAQLVELGVLHGSSLAKAIHHVVVKPVLHRKNRLQLRLHPCAQPRVVEEFFDVIWIIHNHFLPILRRFFVCFKG